MTLVPPGSHWLTERVLNEVLLERLRQDDKWGQQNHPDGTGRPVWAAVARAAKATCDEATRSGRLTYQDILLEEVYEALAESDPALLRAELVQVAAVATAWIEKIDRDTGATS